MRISDWSSDVCSSDLIEDRAIQLELAAFNDESNLPAACHRQVADRPGQTIAGLVERQHPDLADSPLDRHRRGFPLLAVRCASPSQLFQIALEAFQPVSCISTEERSVGTERVSTYRSWW